MTQEPKKLDISQLESVEKPENQKTNSTTYSLLLDVNLEMSAILGEAEISLKQTLDITKGSVIKLDNKTTEPIKLLANKVEVARGEVVIIEDHFGLRITDVTKEGGSEDEIKAQVEQEISEELQEQEEYKEEQEEE